MTDLFARLVRAERDRDEYRATALRLEAENARLRELLETAEAAHARHQPTWEVAHG